MKFKAKLVEAQTKYDHTGDVYTKVILKMYQIPEQGKPDPNAMKNAMFLTGIPYQHKGMINVDIEVPEK